MGRAIAVVVFVASLLFPVQTRAGTGDTGWMSQGTYGIFLHYQYRILLGYSIKTIPQFPNPSEMTAEGWNRFVDGFDVKGFARQMAEAKAGWVLFCLDDHYFAWHGKIYCGNVYHGQGDANQFSDQELIDWINTCNAQGGVCTLDWPFDPQTGLLKDFGLAQLERIAGAVKKARTQEEDHDRRTSFGKGHACGRGPQWGAAVNGAGPGADGNRGLCAVPARERCTQECH